MTETTYRVTCGEDNGCAVELVIPGPDCWSAMSCATEVAATASNAHNRRLTDRAAPFRVAAGGT
jgi:hypothetical protein